MKSRYKVRIHKTELFYFLIFTLFLSPPFLQTISAFHRGWQVLCCGISIIFLIKYLGKPRYFGGFGLVLLFYLSVLFSTIINHGLIMQFLVVVLIGLGFIAFCLSAFEADGMNEYALNALIISLELYVILNFLTVIIFPEGLYRIYGYNLDWGSNPAYLLGHRNNAIEYFLPLIGLVGLKNQKEGKKFSVNFFVVLSVSLLMSVLTWSVNAILCLGFLVLSLVIYTKRGIPGYRLPLLLGASQAVSFLLINIEINPFIQNIIVNVFHKTPSMSGRTRIWGKAILSIREAFLTGHGIQDNYYNYTHLTTVGSCHNYFLDFLYWGGLICFLSMMAYVLYINMRLKIVDRTIENYCNIFLGTYFILWIATPIHKENMFLMISYFFVTFLIAKQINANKMEVR